MTQIELPENLRMLETPGDTVTTWQLLLHNWEQAVLQIPKHQREADAWPPDKQRRFIERIKEARHGCHPPGAIATYQLMSGTGISSVFLNDGLQRLTTMRRLKDSPADFALDEEGAQALLRIQVPRQHRHYADHNRAMHDFQLINAGTHLTPWEMCRGYLKYMPAYDTVWEQKFAEIDEAMKAAENRLQSSNAKTNREIAHKHRRDNLALFYRFMTGEKRATAYQDVAMKQTDRLIDRSDVIELRLIDAISEIGPAAREQVALFTQTIDREVALLDSKRVEILGTGVGLQPVLWRWLLHFAIWRRNALVPVHLQQELVEKALRATNGKGQWPSPDGAVTFGIAHLGRLQRFAELAEMPELLNRLPRRRDSRLKPGFHDSHVNPFSTHGNGATFPEPASLNMARGPRSA